MNGPLAGKVVVAGGSGLVGRHLVATLRAGGMPVVVLTRRPGGSMGGAETRGWDRLPEALEGASAVFNFAGEGIAHRWTSGRKARIRQSRVEATHRLVEALGQMELPPPVLINASAVGWYGSRGGEVIDERTGPGRDFLAQVCRAWEAEADKAQAYGVRVVKLRLGVVLARGGGALPKMALPVKLFQGAKLGHGQQGLSWIHIEDLVAMLLEAARNPAWYGAINACSPRPLTNESFTHLLGRTLHRPILPVPGAITRTALRLLYGEMAQAMLLQGAFVYPRRAAQLGFKFRFAEPNRALADLLG
ncbi:MAG: TIGR01777 family protein [Acidobacteria bacterium]|nr:TIGR01777 family protein [Acidobacteriota bacterium]